MLIGLECRLRDLLFQLPMAHDIYLLLMPQEISIDKQLGIFLKYDFLP